MSDRSAIYAASPGNADEARRALRICLAGLRPPAALAFEGGDFAAWTRDVFLPVLAPYAVAAREMALRGDAAGLIAAEGGLRLSGASAQAGKELLARREGARHLPVARRFAAAVAEGKTPAHFATVFALYAADFSIAVLPMLQCLLYCEWRTRRPAPPSVEMETFFQQAAEALKVLPTLVVPGPGAIAFPAGKSAASGARTRR